MEEKQGAKETVPTSTSAKELPNHVRLSALDGRDLVVPCLLCPFVSTVEGIVSVSGKSQIERLTYMLPSIVYPVQTNNNPIFALPKYSFKRKGDLRSPFQPVQSVCRELPATIWNDSCTIKINVKITVFH